MDKKIYKKIELYLDKENKNINLSLTKDLVNSLLFSYPNYFKTIKSINVCEFNGNFDGIFKINNKEAFWIPEGLFVENILIKDSDYALKENPKVKIKKQHLRNIKEDKIDIPVYTFYVDNIKIIWTDYYVSNIKENIDYIIDFLKQNYSKFLKTIKEINLSQLNDHCFDFYIDGYITNLIFENNEYLLFYNGNLIKKDTEYVVEKNNISKFKSKLRKTPAKEKPEFRDDTYLFKHERPYIWSLFYSVLQNNFKILNLEKNSFYLLIKEFNQIIKNEELNIEDIKYKVELKIEYTNSHPNDMLLYFYKD